MSAQTEFKNFVDHYGTKAALEAVADWLNTQACHFTDEGMNDEREPLDEAESAILDCLEVKFIDR